MNLPRLADYPRPKQVTKWCRPIILCCYVAFVDRSGGTGSDFMTLAHREGERANPRRHTRDATAIRPGGWDWDCPSLVDILKLSAEVFQMPKTRPPYLPEFRRRVVDLVRAGRSPEDFAREFEPTAQLIGAWAAAADKQEGRQEEVAPGMAASERDELSRVRRENKQLRLERDILSKAAAWFARETGVVPSVDRRGVGSLLVG